MCAEHPAVRIFPVTGKKARPAVVPCNDGYTGERRQICGPENTSVRGQSHHLPPAAYFPRSRRDSAGRSGRPNNYGRPLPPAFVSSSRRHKRIQTSCHRSNFCSPKFVSRTSQAKNHSSKDFVLQFRLSVANSNLERRKPTLEVFGTVIGALPSFEFRFHAAVDDKCIAGTRQFLNSRSVHSHTCADDFDPRRIRSTVSLHKLASETATGSCRSWRGACGSRAIGFSPGDRRARRAAEPVGWRWDPRIRSPYRFPRSRSGR